MDSWGREGYLGDDVLEPGLLGEQLAVPVCGELLLVCFAVVDYGVCIWS